jgi:Fe(3+) dicitrate transport protein
MMNLKLKSIVLFMPMLLSALAQAEEGQKIELDEIVVNGILPEKLESVPGSFNIVDEKELEARRPFSIKEALSGVPGLNIIQNEDPLGLAQNIGLRGMDPRRSARTLLMEDGMPLYLAPYGDPSSHYIPMLERVQRIEVVKGSGQVLYGPQTVGGMINFVTRPIPKDGVHGTVSGFFGNNDFTGAYANIGVGGEMGGVMLDIANKKGDGIRDHHEFEVTDITLKGQLNINDQHTLIGKIGTYQEHSNVSETGLGEVDYANDKYQAPSGNNDAFEHERKFAHLQHIFDINNDVRLTTQAYYVDAFRSSFRQTDAPGGYDDEEAGLSTGVTIMDRCPDEVLTEASAAQCGGRHRPRHYNYYGVEPRLDFKHSWFGVESDAVVGFRYHQEDIKRQQYRDSDPRAQSLAWAKANGSFREDIRIDVEAKSYYAQNTLHIGDFDVTPGLRVEDMRFKTKVNQAGGDPQNAKVTNNQTEVLPGFGVAWNGISNTTVFAGVHKGFSPPRPDRDLRADGENTAEVDKTSPETSINWEVGVRSKYYKAIAFESTLFHTKFDDIVVRTTSGSFDNAGKAVMTGMEFAGRVDFGQLFDSVHNFYVMANYTNLWTAKFDSTSPNAFSTVDAGEVTTAGDGVVSGKRLPYAPKHMASVSFGYQHPIGIDARIGLDYISKQEVDGPFRDYVLNAADPTGADASLSGLSGDIPSYTLFNASINFKPVDSKMTYFLSGHNLTDREYLASRVDGMSAGRGRQVFGGVRFDF